MVTDVNAIGIQIICVPSDVHSECLKPSVSSTKAVARNIDLNRFEAQTTFIQSQFLLKREGHLPLAS